MSAVRDTSGLRALTGISIRDAGNALRTVSQGFARDAGNVSRLIFSAFGGGSGATVSPTSVRGTGRSNYGIDISTDVATCTVSGGATPIAYAWTQTGGDTFTILDPTSASTAFVANNVPAGPAKTATFTCTATDANGLTAISNEVTATARNLGGYA